jgi:hypothetical protein
METEQNIEVKHGITIIPCSKCVGGFTHNIRTMDSSPWHSHYDDETNIYIEPCQDHKD